MGTVLLIGKNFWESACNDDTVYQDIKGIIRGSTYTHGVIGGAGSYWYHGLNCTFSEKVRYPQCLSYK